MKRIIALIMVVAMTAMIFACGNGVDETTTPDAQSTTEAPSTTGGTKTPDSTTSQVVYEYQDEEGKVIHLSMDEINDDGTLNDVSTNDHVATVNGDVEVVAEGRVYSALRLNRNRKHSVTLKDADDLDLAKTKDFTIELYIKFSNVSKLQCIFQKGHDGSGDYFGLWIGADSKLYMESKAGVIKATSTVQMGKWYKIVIIQNAADDRITLILDKEVLCKGNAINAGAGDIIFGAGKNGTADYCSGFFDDFKVFNYAKNVEDFAKVEGVDKMAYETFQYTAANGDKLDLPYRYYYPTNYDETKEYPMLFFLHGFGECGTENEQQIRIGGASCGILDRVVAADNCIIVAPQCQKQPAALNWIDVGQIWTTCCRENYNEDPTISLAAAMALLDEYLAKDEIDTDRVYISGVSMGGYATWEVIARRPDTFAAAIPVCGAGILSSAKDLGDMAIWAFHGLADDTVPPRGTQDMQKAFEEAGQTVVVTGTDIVTVEKTNNKIFTYYNNVYHNAWIPAYNEAELIDWMFAQSK